MSVKIINHLLKFIVFFSFIILFNLHLLGFFSVFYNGFSKDKDSKPIFTNESNQNVVKAYSPGLNLWNSLSNDSFRSTTFNEFSYATPFNDLTDNDRVNNNASESGHGVSIITELRDEVNGSIKVVSIAYGDAFIFNETNNNWEYQSLVTDRTKWHHSIVPAVKFNNRIYFISYWTRNNVNSFILGELALKNNKLITTHYAADGNNLTHFFLSAHPQQKKSASIAVAVNQSGQERLVVFARNDDPNVGHKPANLYVYKPLSNGGITPVNFIHRNFISNGFQDSWYPYICRVGAPHNLHTFYCWEKIDRIFSFRSPNNEFFVGFVDRNDNKLKFLNVTDGLDVVHFNNNNRGNARLNPWAIVDSGHKLTDGRQTCGGTFSNISHVNLRSDGFTSISVGFTTSCNWTVLGYVKLIELRGRTNGIGAFVSVELYTHFVVDGRRIIFPMNGDAYVIDAGNFTEIIIDGVSQGSIYSFYECLGARTTPNGGTGHSPIRCNSSFRNPPEYGFKMAYQWTNPGWGHKAFPKVPAVVGYISERLQKFFVGNRNGTTLRMRTTFDVKGIWVADVPIARNECTISIVGFGRLSVLNRAVDLDVTGYSRRSGNGRLVVSRSGFNNYEKFAFINRRSDGFFIVRFTLTLDEIDQRFTGSTNGPYGVKIQFFLPDNQGCQNNLNVEISVVPPPRNNSCNLSVSNQGSLFVGNVTGFSRNSGNGRLIISRPQFNNIERFITITLREDGYFTASFNLSLQELENNFWDLTGNNYSLNYRFILPDNQTSCQTNSTVFPYSRPTVSASIQCSTTNPNNPYSIRMVIDVNPSNYPGSFVNEVFVVFNAMNTNFQSPMFNYDLARRSFSVSQSFPFFAKLSRPNNIFVFGNGGGIASLSGGSNNNNNYVVNISFNLNNGFQNITEINNFIENGFRIAIAVADSSGRVNLQGLQPIPPSNVQAAGVLLLNSFISVDNCNPLMQVTTTNGDIGDYGGYPGIRIDRVAYNQASTNSSVSASLSGPLLVSDFVYENVSNICNNSSNVRLRVGQFCRNVSQRPSADFLNITGLSNNIVNSVDQTKRLDLNLNSGSVLNINSNLNNLNTDKKIILITLNNSGDLTINDNLNEVRQPLIIICRNCVNLFINQLGTNQIITGANLVNNSYQLNIASNSVSQPKRIYVTNNNIYLGNQQNISTQPQFFIGAFIAGRGLHTARTYSTTGIFGIAYSMGVVARGKADIFTPSNTNTDIIFRHFAGLNNTFPLLVVHYDPWYKFWIEQVISTDQSNKKIVILGI